MKGNGIEVHRRQNELAESLQYCYHDVAIRSAYLWRKQLGIQVQRALLSPELERREREKSATKGL